VTSPKIAFIGAGNMARAIIGGLLAQGFAPGEFIASGPHPEKLADLAAQGLQTISDNLAAARQAQVVVLSVKPQLLKAVAQALAPALAHKPLIISVAAGITTESLGRWLGEDQALVRSMPNTPAQLRLGATGAYANTHVSSGQRQLTEQILGAVGKLLWVEEESLINAVTAVSGSGPAYYFLFMEAMMAAGVAQGLNEETARELTLQTALGAAHLALNSQVDVAELRRRVTSPKGTTEAAISVFESQGLRQCVAEAMAACSARAQELSEQLGQ
jgi:pyrroline-5-carboxylate reductase